MNTDPAARAQELLNELDTTIDRKYNELPHQGDFKYLEAKVAGYRGFILSVLTQGIADGWIP